VPGGLAGGVALLGMEVVDLVHSWSRGDGDKWVEGGDRKGGWGRTVKRRKQVGGSGRSVSCGWHNQGLWEGGLGVSRHKLR